MNYSAYAEFCRSIGYKVYETPKGIWIGPSNGFFNRVPHYETVPPSEQELHLLFKKYRIVGVSYAAAPGSKGCNSSNYFIRDRNYDLNMLDKKGRWSVRKGLENCHVRPMGFDELSRLGMALNLDTLNRQERKDPMFTSKAKWQRLCRAGEQVDQVEAWGSFVGEELAAYLISIQLGNVVSLLYSHSLDRFLTFHPSPALFFSVVKTMMQRPGIEAVYNGPQWLTSGESLDRFKQRLGFVPEPVTFVTKLRPLAKRIVLNRKVRRATCALGSHLLNEEFHQRIESVLDMAVCSTARKSPVFKAGDLVRIRSRDEIERTLDPHGELLGCLFMDEMWAYCGTVQRVLKPMVKYLCEEDYKVRECDGVYLLEGLMCQGTQFAEGCDCSCLFFWREEWLERVPEN